MALTSGGSFGFFMGVGAIMRSGDAHSRNQNDDEDYQVRTINPSNGIMSSYAMIRNIEYNRRIWTLWAKLKI